MGQIPFCEKCGKMLELKNFMDIKMGICECGFKKFVYDNMNIEDKSKKKEEIGKGVLENKDETEGFPNLCPKCGHNFCDVHDLGAPYSDESNVYLFRCRKCGYVVRQADGSGNN